MPKPFRVGLIQMSCPDPKDNLDKAVAKVREAAAAGAQIVLLQELFRAQYFCREVVCLDYFDLAEPIPGPTTDVMSRLAKELGIAIVASIFERRGPGLYHNTAVVLNPDGAIAGVYRKMHIPDDPSYFEKYYFTPGDLGFGSIETPFAKLGVLVCWDQWYPEAARITAMTGADILVYPTAIGWVPEDKADGAWQIEAWQTMQRSHAIANGLFVAGINRVGRETKDRTIDFWGSSFVSDPNGRMMAVAPVEEEAILVVECDPAQTEYVRRNWPFFRDRRIDAYGPILNRWIGDRKPGQ